MFQNLHQPLSLICGEALITGYLPVIPQKTLYEGYTTASGITSNYQVPVVKYLWSLIYFVSFISQHKIDDRGQVCCNMDLQKAVCLCSWEEYFTFRSCYCKTEKIAIQQLCIKSACHTSLILLSPTHFLFLLLSNSQMYEESCKAYFVSRPLLKDFFLSPVQKRVCDNLSWWQLNIY